MLLINTKVDVSKIHGLGLFALQSISKNDVIAKLNKFDIKVKATDIPKEYINFFNFYNSKQGDIYQIYFDNMRFMNHSDNPNCIDMEDGSCIALKDIKVGEELTCNYKLICDIYKNK